MRRIPPRTTCVLPHRSAATAYTSYRCRCPRCVAWSQTDRMAARRAKADTTPLPVVRDIAPIQLRPSAWEPWRNDAACVTQPDVFFPEDDSNKAAVPAKAICAECPVRIECREHALETREPYGIWGGLTAAERRTELRRRHRESLRSFYEVAS